ncbi:steroid 17-alpha-hydroxylase/17,20 lyase-like [Actinia tenebrosa]|uniref:Steroid 21-hydroxylase n=1 Tax=Actinia tenebrosa TaxID=6105 RepID=A0A6P8H3J2_ACTTE|nr:steroid 17-alpha-hydroxylase/17,20 lyase-like [Actinia tenebrosa]XP_031550022.1 steroid 17-alpha-hydroxylase/17,20 lyase-like [Actinia tenebrosa]XP_031550023.1 steroid 17-alpha-hydroxylase/17,20 lyase-like [Actinia tenebrosa]
MFVEVGVLVFAAIVLWEIYLILTEPRNLPPGFRVPSLISLVTFPTNVSPHKRLLNAGLSSGKYGDVSCLRIGRQLMVVVSSFETAREALVQKGFQFAGRPSLEVAKQITRDGKDVVLGDFGPGWRMHRKIVLSALKTYGVGLSILENKISVEAEAIVETFQTNLGNPFNPRPNIVNAVLNIICAILFGERYSLNDPEFYEIERFHSSLTRIFAKGQILDIFPLLKYLPVQIMRDIKEAVEFRDRFFERKLAEHRDKFQDAETVPDLTYELLKAAQEANTDQECTTKEYLTDDHLVGTMMDVFLAGAETTATTILWVLAYMVSYPEVQACVQKEFDDVIGRERLPSLSDRGSLPYFEATIKETIRHATPFVVGAPHKTTTDTTLKGYNIPKDTMVIFNLWQIHHDPRHWKNPNDFEPTRFLDEQGKLLNVSTLSYMPFSLGPRACLGESLAKTELFLFLSRLLYEFKFENPPDVPPPDMEGTFGVVQSPKPYKVVVKKRF